MRPSLAGIHGGRRSPHCAFSIPGVQAAGAQGSVTRWRPAAATYLISHSPARPQDFLGRSGHVALIQKKLFFKC